MPLQLFLLIFNSQLWERRRRAAAELFLDEVRRCQSLGPGSMPVSWKIVWILSWKERVANRNVGANVTFWQIFQEQNDLLQTQSRFRSVLGRFLAEVNTSCFIPAVQHCDNWSKSMNSTIPGRWSSWWTPTSRVSHQFTQKSQSCLIRILKKLQKSRPCIQTNPYPRIQIRTNPVDTLRNPRYPQSTHRNTPAGLVTIQQTSQHPAFLISTNNSKCHPPDTATIRNQQATHQVIRKNPPHPPVRIHSVQQPSIHRTWNLPHNWQQRIQATNPPIMKKSPCQRPIPSKLGPNTRSGILTEEIPQNPDSWHPAESQSTLQSNPHLLPLRPHLLQQQLIIQFTSRKWTPRVRWGWCLASSAWRHLQRQSDGV